jgi:hypothetical protein
MRGVPMLGRRRRAGIRAAVLVGAVAASWLIVGVPPAGALTASEVQLLTSPNLEILPSANDTMLAWSQNSRKHPRFFNEYVKPLSGGKAKRLNAEGSRGFNGGFDGTKLVFQQISHEGQSDLVIYDTATDHYDAVPSGVNTNRWEASPSMSGDYLLFSRETPRRTGFVDRLVLHQVSTGHEQVLRKLFSDYRHGPFIDPGQVNGDYAAWDVCSRSAGCNVFRHQISTDHTQMVPDRQQEYASSVAADGTVFFMRSAPGCGRKARLMRFSGGTGELVEALARNRDTFSTFAIDASHLVRDAVNCHTQDINVNLTTIS